MRRIALALILAAALTPAFARAQTAKLSPNAPQDRPRKAVLTEAEKDRLIQPYADSARATYPAARARFLAGLDKGQSFFVTTRLHDAAGRYEQVFVVVGRIENGRVYGRISSDIGLVQGYRYGQPYDLPESEIVDWLITYPDGHEEGNYVGRFLERQMAAKS